MNSNILIMLAMSIIPMLAIGFVLFLVIYKVYIKIRSRFNVSVNCWFCNQNTKVPFLEANSWTCPSCEQYNGFDKDGDYNREIYEQLDCGRTPERFNVSQQPPELRQNGFCDVCNEAQRLKVEKLAQFEPKNESRWDKEFNVYKTKLEDEYRLCSTCNNHLKKVLREKKKMVLGSKFLNFIIKGAEALKQPHLDQIKHAKQEHRKQRLRTLIAILAFVNFCCLLGELSTLNKDYFVQFFGESVGHQVFVIVSHIIAIVKVVDSYLNTIKKHAVVTKILLFLRTLFMMAMYSMGLKVTHFNFPSMFVSFCPFAILCLSFLHNIVDSFRLTRLTGMLVIWSLFAGGLIDQTWTLTPQILMLFTSMITFVMAYTSKPEPSPKLHDNTVNSFHKIYSEDYLSDEDTVSVLSQQLNDSSVSMRSVRSNKSFRVTSPSIQSRVPPRFTKSPLTSSFSLNQIPRSQISPNSSFRSYAEEENHIMRPIFATPIPLSTKGRKGLFASNLELNSGDRSQPTLSGANTSVVNSTIFNNSFTESRYVNQTQNNETSFYTAVKYSATPSMFVNNSNTFLTPNSQYGIHSPSSISNRPVPHHQYHQYPGPTTHHKLLSPTRFSTNNLTSSNVSWLSGGYFNQRQSMAEIPRNGLVVSTQAKALTTSMDESLSRSSSHSSGFESQNGRINSNTSRENSLCPDLNTDCHQRTLTTDNVNSFQPIDSPCLRSFSSRPLFSSPSLNSFSNGNSEIWKQSTFNHKYNVGNNFSKSSIDSFNLRKINEELPSIKRDDLLKKWKEGQTIS